ncbi:MAG: YbaK/EbsC family protein [Clostridia bacterium]|nr:YbaK/EbsC family protein [Clostridia bacterium]
MSMEKARAHLAKYGLEDRIIELEQSSATVALAAEALGCAPEHIAKTLSFVSGESAILILAAGTARIDNAKFKARFGMKAKMLPAEVVEEIIGHGVGGVCPFGVNPGIPVYLDESLKAYETVYPAAGNAASGVRLSVEELLSCSEALGFVDVCK